MGEWSSSQIKRPEHEKTCLCITCGRWFHPLGIMRHRAAHRDRSERCEIEFSDGRVIDYRFETIPQQEARHAR